MTVAAFADAEPTLPELAAVAVAVALAARGGVVLAAALPGFVRVTLTRLRLIGTLRSVGEADGVFLELLDGQDDGTADP